MKKTDLIKELKYIKKICEHNRWFNAALIVKNRIEYYKLPKEGQK